MNTTCFLVHEYTLLASPYSSSLDDCWVETYYHDLCVFLELHNVEDILDFNFLNFPSDEQIEGIKALATGSINNGQRIFDPEATDHMSGSLAQNTSPISAIVTVAGEQRSGSPQ